jgi:curved DNA-binding protein CbpA
MDYYEELDVPRSASIDEIRRAYRTLATLIHPDRQQRKGTKRLAECQMRRLNLILATLQDPEKRAQYDSEISGKPTVRVASNPKSVVRSPRGSKTIWTMALIIGSSAIYLYHREDLLRSQWTRYQKTLPASAAGNCEDTQGLLARVQQLEQEMVTLRKTTEQRARAARPRKLP